MRVSRKDESIYAESGVLFQSCCDCFWISNQRRAGSATNQANPGPQIRTNLQPVALTAMELGHPLLAFGIKTRKRLLRGCNTFVRNVAQKFVSSPPRLLFGVAYNDVNSQAKAERSSEGCSRFSHCIDFRGDIGRRFSPGEINV